MPSHYSRGPRDSPGTAAQDYSGGSAPDGSLTRHNRSQKKKEVRNRTRSVNTMSAAQLERKRANDREAQRTIRQRTKEHIESLEKQVTELTARGKQLDNANLELESQVAELKQQLMSQQHLSYSDMGNLRVPSASSFGNIARRCKMP
ncbi:MAG: hypothetical protein Q9227_000307 [Pyrenula ochraceoflavens]